MLNVALGDVTAVRKMAAPSIDRGFSSDWGESQRYQPSGQPVWGYSSHSGVRVKCLFTWSAYRNICFSEGEVKELKISLEFDYVIIILCLQKKIAMKII